MKVRFFDNGDALRRQQVEQALRSQATELEIDLDVVDDDGTRLGADELVVYLGTKGAPSISSAQHDALADHAEQRAMLPVLDTPEDAQWLPDPVKPINALIAGRFGAQWPAAVVDEILSRLYLRRRTRRVFISYRRIDSLGIARQLLDALTKRGFEVFLDEVSIPPSEDFQRSLEAWLIDADLVLVLASPRFEESKWTTEEISFAGNANIGMLVVGWPPEVYGKPAAVPFGGDPNQRRPAVEATAGLPDERWELTLAELASLPGTVPARRFEDPAALTLTPEALEGMIGLALRARSKAIGQRLRTLLETARTVLGAQGQRVENGATLGDLVVHGKEGKSFVRVVPFRPGPETLHQAWQDARGRGATHGDEAGLYYSEVDASMDAVVALRWLAEGKRPEPPQRTVVYAEVGGKVQP
ncbi:MAG: toll/interleukin-1 receptor domain-containing protein [Nannocystaceae bacterium]